MRIPCFLLLLCFMITSAAFTQTGEKTLGIDLGIGAASPIHSETRKTLALGWTASLGFNTSFLQFNKLTLRPVAGLKWYMKEIAEVNSVTEHFRSFKAGLQVEYAAFAEKNIRFSPIVRIDYNWSKNYFSKSTYNPWSNFSTVTYSDYFLRGSAVSADLGLRANIGKYYVQVHYEHYQPELDVNPFFVEDAKHQGMIIPSSHKYNFSSVNLAVGFNLNWKL